VERPRNSAFSVAAAVVVALVLAHLGGCSSPRWKRHFDGGAWGGAFTAQVTRPDRYIPEAIVLATIPPAFIYEDDIQEHFANNDTTTSEERLASDSLQFILPGLAVLIAGAKWEGGDEGRNFEVTAEALGGIVILQQATAHLVGRERPDGGTLSFPSGHTSWAFAATTLLVRDMHDPSDTSMHPMDGLIYLPAIYGAWERLAINHHWAGDVAVGAFMGMFWTNLVWDLHFKGNFEDRPTVYGKDQDKGFAWRPTVDMIDGNLAVGVRVDF
jgi:hypothetical protein